MTFRFQLVERVREHYAKHIQQAAALVPPETIALATAIEAELQRFTDHLRSGLQSWQASIKQRIEEPEDGA